jgi:NAD(P)-dependent dehydrogenase (short-subunit alcohol dehydrogenase family)
MTLPAGYVELSVPLAAMVHSTPQILIFLLPQVYLVTGSSGGLGKGLAAMLYARHATVYVAARSESKCVAAIKDIKDKYPSSHGALVFHELDLNDLEAVKASGQRFLARETRLDVLWLNAGVMLPPEGSKTKQGYELQLGVNVVAHHLFASYLKPMLAATVKIAPRNSVRVVWVSSAAALGAPCDPIDFANMDYHKSESSWKMYQRSKAGSILLALEFGRRTAGEGILSVVCLELLVHGAWLRR